MGCLVLLDRVFLMCYKNLLKRVQVDSDKIAILLQFLTVKDTFNKTDKPQRLTAV